MHNKIKRLERKSKILSALILCEKKVYDEALKLYDDEFNVLVHKYHKLIFGVEPKYRSKFTGYFNLMFGDLVLGNIDYSTKIAFNINLSNNNVRKNPLNKKVLDYLNVVLTNLSKYEKKYLNEYQISKSKYDDSVRKYKDYFNLSKETNIELKTTIENHILQEKKTYVIKNTEGYVYFWNINSRVDKLHVKNVTKKQVHVEIFYENEMIFTGRKRKETIMMFYDRYKKSMKLDKISSRKLKIKNFI